MVTASIIIVTYNGKGYMQECLDTVFKQDFKDFEVVLVDNASSDGTAEFVKQNFPNVKLIESKDNLGFAEGNNLAISNSSGKYIVLLNQDTAVESNWLSELVTSMEKDDKIGIVQPLIIFYNDKTKVNTSGIMTNYIGFGWCADYNKNVDDMVEKEICFPSGASLITKREIFDKAGGFDKDYFMYQEDLDLGWRTRLLGYKIMINPRSKVYHKYVFKSNTNKMFYHEKNRLISMYKNYSRKTLVLIFPMFLFFEGAVIVHSIMGRYFLKKIKSYRYFFSHLKQNTEKRKIIQKMRVVSDKEILRNFSDEFSFDEVNTPFVNRVISIIIAGYGKILRAVL